MKISGGQGFAVSPVWALTIHKELFPEMLQAIPSMAQRVVSTLLDRVREVTRIEQQAEKLSSLNKLAGNLAHELNNPASAAQRAAANLVTELRANRANRFKLVNLCLSDEQIRKIEDWEQRVLSRNESPQDIDAGDLIVREEGLRTWLNDLPTEGAWDIAAQLNEQGVTCCRARHAADVSAAQGDFGCTAVFCAVSEDVALGRDVAECVGPDLRFDQRGEGVLVYGSRADSGSGCGGGHRCDVADAPVADDACDGGAGV